MGVVGLGNSAWPTGSPQRACIFEGALISLHHEVSKKMLLLTFQLTVKAKGSK